MVYVIEPIDNFFFRMPVPFERGGETAAVRSIFPPLPSVYAGAFRMFQKEPQKQHQLKIKLSSLWWEGTHYFPMPLDLYPLRPQTELENDTWELEQMQLKKACLSNYSLDYMPFMAQQSGKKEKDRKPLHLSEKNLLTYLNGDCDGQTGQTATIIGENILGRLVDEEPKIGIEVDARSGTSKHQQLYQVAYVRPQKGLKLAVEAEGISLAKETLIKLGGEGKVAKVQTEEHSFSFDLTGGSSDYFKLYIATPAIFEKGWLPGWINEKTKIGRFKYKKREIKVKLISACVGKKVPCGGFGYADGQFKPREMRYAVPAGSVYYFKILQGTMEDAIKLFHQKCISEYRESVGFQFKTKVPKNGEDKSVTYQLFDRNRYCDRGFGYAFVGKCSKMREE